MSIEKIKELREITGSGIMNTKKALEASNGDIDVAIKWLRENGIAKAAKRANKIAAEGSIFSAFNSNKAVLIELNSETDFVASNEEFTKVGKSIALTILNSSVKTLEESMELEINDEKIKMLIINLTAKMGEKITLRKVEISENNPVIYVHSNNRIGVIVESEGMEKEIVKGIAMHIAAMKPQFLSLDDISNEEVKEETDIAKKELAEKLIGKPENIVENMIQGKVQKTLAELVLLEQPYVRDGSKKVKDLQGTGKLIKFTRIEVGEGIQKAKENFAAEVASQVDR